LVLKMLVGASPFVGGGSVWDLGLDVLRGFSIANRSGLPR